MSALLTFEEAATRAGVKEDRLREAVRKGAIRAVPPVGLPSWPLRTLPADQVDAWARRSGYLTLATEVGRRAQERRRTVPPTPKPRPAAKPPARADVTPIPASGATSTTAPWFRSGLKPRPGMRLPGRGIAALIRQAIDPRSSDATVKAAVARLEQAGYAYVPQKAR